jgi:NTP pyrophosphatase (non-canonical NTP hydrolase)
MALASEAGELLDIFRWLSEAQSVDLTPEQLEATADELVDVLWFLVRIVDVLDIDIGKAFERKLQQNNRRYGAEQARGSAKKR